MKFTKEITIMDILILLLIFVFSCMLAIQFIQNNKEEDEESKVVEFEPSDPFLVKLAKCESGGKHEVVIIDVNGKTSAGKYQFQKKLLSDYMEKNFGIAITADQYIKLATHPLIVDSIAKDIIKNNFQGGVSNWANCNNIINGV